MKISTLHTSTNLKEVKEHYRRIKTNTIKFNKGRLSHKSTSTGYCCNFYYKGELKRNISIQSENGIHRLEVLNF